MQRKIGKSVIKTSEKLGGVPENDNKKIAKYNKLLLEKAGG